MSLQLFGRNKEGNIEQGWFEPEESRKKRDNGWVTDIKKLEVVDEPEEEPVAEKELDKPEETKIVEKEIKKSKKSIKKPKK